MRNNKQYGNKDVNCFSVKVEYEIPVKYILDILMEDPFSIISVIIFIPKTAMLKQ